LKGGPALPLASRRTGDCSRARGDIAVNDSNPPRFFRTLRGFLNGEEPDEENYFHFCAVLRIYGDGVPFEEITRTLGVEPTHLHRKGEQRRPSSPAWRDDTWQFQPPVAEHEPLEHHIDALWAVLRPHVDDLKSLKQQFKVDIFMGYRSNCDTAGFEVPHQSLEMFRALEVPFGISVIVA
jgi:hypothetical protein